MDQRARATADRRLRLASGLLFVVVAVLAGRLIQVQGVEGPHYARLAQEQRLRDVTLTALRGPILDASGRPLAESVDARDIYADPTQVRAATADPSSIAAKLAPLLHLPAALLTTRLTVASHFSYLCRGVSPEVANAVQALNLPGVGILPSARRIYPDGTLAPGIVGFVGFEGHGLAGLEYAYDSLLAGHDGKQIVETGADGRVIPEGENVDVPAQPGNGIELTINSAIEWEAQRAINTQVKATGATSGTVIVMNPHTGALLAVATAPSFDDNVPGHASAAALGDPAVTDAYEPGSVNKVITMSAALAQGVVTPLTPVTVPPVLRYDGTLFHDAEVHGTEHLTVTGVLAQSSNIGTIEIAQQLGAATLFRYLKAYGYGQATGSGLPGDTDGILPPLDSWSGTTLPTVAFGQGVAVTAMQVASVYATIANGGVRVAPTIVKGTVGPTGALTPAARRPGRRVISSAVAHELSDMLEAVTTDQGTAPAAEIPGYRVAGKTGTAQRPNGKGGYSGYTASFVGFAPADRPALVVEVVLQAPVNGHFGGTVAAPVFHDVMSFGLEALGIPPTGTRAPVAQITVP